MNRRKLLFLGGRIIFGLFCLLTSVYCLLAYIPFTYYHFLQFRHVSALSWFVELHPYLYLIVLALVAATLLDDLRAQKVERAAFAFIVFHTLIGAALVIHPLLTNLKNDLLSFVWSLIAIEPLLWLALIDYFRRQSELVWAGAGREEDQRLFRAALFTALFVTLLYAVISIVKQAAGLASSSGTAEKFLTTAWSLASHLLIFMAIFIALSLIRAVAGLFKTPPRAEFILCVMLGAVLIALALNHTALGAISLTGTTAHLYALVSGSALMMTLAGLALRLWPGKEVSVTSGFGLAVAPLTTDHISSLLLRATWIALIIVLAYLGSVKLVVMDWNFLIQKLTANIVWVMTFIFFYAAIPGPQERRDRALALLLIAASSLGVYKALEACGAYLPRLDTVTKLDHYSGRDISFKLVHELLTPAQSGGDFYRFLLQNTNIAHTVNVDPVDLNLVQKLTRTDGPKPYIFIFVIDSLRRDYLSPYNNAVTFTPAVESFARESIVMENAFTHYGATGLSEPSIWVGGMMLHKQYITPFYPMNTLQKLIEAEGYQSLISLDTILRVVVRQTATITDLDADVPNKEYDFCHSLKNLQDRLDQRPGDAPPTFAYTQPMNIHVSTINREGKSVPPGESYPGFYAPYASRIRRIDACFGAFVDFLKKKGLYEQSIIVLTADHGDSLGEEGRWGHAYTIFPEVIRIPLLIHLPPQMRKNFVWNTKLISFSTDITPSLYYLLGHQPTARSELLGRPLFTATEPEQRGAIQDNYLIASSYGAVYGLLRNNGRYLYISDGVNYTDYFYDLINDSRGARNLVTPALKIENEQLIRERVRAINEFYRFNPGQ